MGAAQQEADSECTRSSQLPRFGVLAHIEFAVIEEFVEFNDDTDDNGEITGLAISVCDVLRNDRFAAPGVVRASMLLSIEVSSSCCLPSP